MSEVKPKVTKEVLREDARFILANVAASRIGGENRFHDIRNQCETSISIPFAEYVAFLEQAGYLRHDRASDRLEITGEGEVIAKGGGLNELTDRAVAHFKSASRRRKDEPARASVERVYDRGVDRAFDRINSDRDRFQNTPAPVGPPPAAPPVHMPSGGELHNTSELMDSRYEKLATIGTGGIGTVYRARQVPLNREVALKEIRDLFNFFAEEQRPEIVRRFTDVVRSAAQLAHPNIVPIHEVNLEREYPYVVTELSPNGSCRRLISDAETIPVELVLRYLMQSLHALQAAHYQRVYHRGLKPENLLIDNYGNLKVSDFGFARIVERDAAVIRQVYVGMGNIAYMAPELYHDPVAAGPQTDVYAMGIIFYELLTRRLPGRRSPMPSEVNAALPRGIDDIFDRMTRDSRAERYPTVDDILDDISRIEGLAAVMDQATQVLVMQNPLEQIKFREDSLTDVTPTDATPTEVAGEIGADGKPSSTYRPYSYKQRRKR
jgi:hypothetical protein